MQTAGMFEMRRFLTAALATVCMADAFKFCGSLINLFAPDQVAIGTCLYQHRTELEPDCQAAMKDFKPQSRAVPKGKQNVPGRP
jgi:hypothetical protein